MNTVADILERAADLLEPEGAWMQGMASGNDGCQCAQTAIFFVNEGPEASDALEVLAGLIDPSSERTAFGTVWEWNDALDRTQAEVVAKLREAAAKARGETA